MIQADQINCLKPLEILDFGLALAYRQRLFKKKRTIWCVFCLVFPALLDFVLGGEVVRSVRVLFLLGHAIPPQSRPTPEKTQKP